jgi:putative NADH-flavin reductase
MRLAIFGATGGTGLELTRQALERGHNVRALVRNPNRMTLMSENLRIVLGNVLDHESVTKTVLGCDAVLDCLGQRNLMRNTRVVSVGTHLIMAVMKEHGVRRLVVESAFGAGESLTQANFLQRLVFSTLLWAPFQDKNVMEPEVKSSGLEWTILRPTKLTNAGPAGHYTTTFMEPALSWVLRADVATAMLRAVEDGLWVGESPTVTAALEWSVKVSTLHA